MKKAKISKDQLFELVKKVTEEAANATGAGATFTPGAGEQYATSKAFKKKVKESNTSTPFEKGFKHGTHPGSKAMDYKQLYENPEEYTENQDLDELDINDPVLMAMRAKKDAPTPVIQNSNPNQSKINMLLKKRAEIERDMEQEAEPEGGPIADKYATDLMKIDAAIKKLRRPVGVQEETLAEGYAQFKNETKTRSKPEQFHQAVKAVKKRVQEIHKLFEYVSKLKTELSEDKDGLKYKAHTEKAIGQIKEMVMNLNKNMRKFK